jgi:hypothetical protein
MSTRFSGAVCGLVYIEKLTSYRFFTLPIDKLQICSLSMAGPGPHTRNRSNAAQTAGEDSNLHSVEIVTEPVNADYDTQLKQPSPEIPITNIFSPHSSDAGTQPTPTKQSSSTQQCS